jgi:hypothetical protein
MGERQQNLPPGASTFGRGCRPVRRAYLYNFYRVQPDFVYSVSRDFARSCRTPMLVMPDDTPAHPYRTSVDVASLGGVPMTGRQGPALPLRARRRERWRRGRMRVSTMIRISPRANPDSGLIDRITDFARQVEPRGFPGIWIGDSLGRGRPTLDSLQVLTALAAVTHRVELGISVLQLPLRNPIELAHRVQSLQAMSNNRLILGVGSGSTRDDFELLGYDYDHRFRTFKNDLEIMNRVWNGEPVNGGTLSTWPGCKGGPPILIGAWRSPRWITPPRKPTAGRRPVGSAAGKISNMA